ncbi:MAG: DUF368 domain-containing protein [Planctomycetota bacterium]
MNDSPPAEAPTDTEPARPAADDTEPRAGFSASLGVRAAAGGALMGLANLVPGISGGTMLVAVGIYRRFIDAIADTTRLKIKPDSIALLGIVVLAAVAAIGGLAGVIADALVGFRWGMYSLFIGLTLGGVPLLWAMLRKGDNRLGPAAIGGFLAGLAVMIGLVLAQSAGSDGAADASGPVMLALGGAAAASAMILPGVSGAYLLLLLGQYDAVINAIKSFVSAAADADLDGMLAELAVVVPIGIGVVAGVVGVSNVLRFVIHRYEKATLGVLLGLLVAAPLGLYPFREGVEPQVGGVIRGQTVTEDTIEEIDPKDWRQELFRPSAMQIAGSVGLIVGGFGVTLGIARLGREKPPR